MIKRFHNVLPDHMLAGALASFPDFTWPHWYPYSSGKLATTHAADIPRACMQALLTIAELVSPTAGFWDVDYMTGAGLHLMPAGCELGRHTDAQRHQRIRNWQRTGSLVCFLNDCSGGELVVGGETVPAIANTAAMFDGQIQHAVSWTHTDRKTLCLFSYTVNQEAAGTITATFE